MIGSFCLKRRVGHTSHLNYDQFHSMIVNAIIRMKKVDYDFLIEMIRMYERGIIMANEKLS